MARILVVDDEHNVRTMMQLALEFSGHSVQVAADGEEALSRFRSEGDFELVILDQRMPGLSGLEVLRSLKDQNPSIRVIMATAFGTVDLAVDAMKAGATDFLRKPFTAEVLRGAVDAAIEDNELRPSNAMTFGFTTINGYRIIFEVGGGQHSTTGFQQRFTINDPAGADSTCVVVLPAYVMELVKAHTDHEVVPGGDRFWQSLCEEALANYLWQNAGPPENGVLRIEELTSGLRRFVDAVLAA